MEVLSEEVGDVFDPGAEVSVDARVEEGDPTTRGDQTLRGEPEVAASVEGAPALDDAARLCDALYGGVDEREASGAAACLRLTCVERLDELCGRRAREEEAHRARVRDSDLGARGARVLLEDDVGVDAAEAEGVDRRAARPVGLPGLGCVDRTEARPSEPGVGLVDVQGGG